MLAKVPIFTLLALWLLASGCGFLTDRSDQTTDDEEGAPLDSGSTPLTEPDAEPPQVEEDATSGPFVSLESSGSRFCGLLENKTIRCWSDRWLPRPAAEGQFRSIGSGNLNACGIRSSGAIGCPRRGISPRLRKAVPVEGSYTHLTGTIGFGCALREDGTVLCFGDERSPRTLEGRFKAIEAVNDFVCGLTLEGDVVCSARSKYRELDLKGGPFVRIGVEHRGVCGLREDGSVACSKAIDVGDSPVTGIKSITRNGSSICGIDGADSIHCWGYLGRSDPMPPIGRYLAAASGFGRFCAILEDRSVQCWGERHGFESGVPSVQTPEHILVKNLTSKSDVRLRDVRGVEISFEYKIEGGSKRIDYYISSRLRGDDGAFVRTRSKAKMFSDTEGVVRSKAALDENNIGQWASAEIFFPFFSLDLQPGAHSTTAVFEGQYLLEIKGRPRLVKLVGSEPLAVDFVQPPFKNVTLKVNRIEVAEGSYDFTFGAKGRKRLPDLAWSLSYAARYHAEIYRSSTARDTYTISWHETQRPFVFSDGDRLTLTVLDQDVASPDVIGRFTFSLEELQAAVKAGQPLKRGKVVSL